VVHVAPVHLHSSNVLLQLLSLRKAKYKNCVYVRTTSVLQWMQAEHIFGISGISDTPISSHEEVD
jgi:hypothetical protein